MNLGSAQPRCLIIAQDPSSHFQHPQYLATGNLFWPDAWHGEVGDAALLAYGLKPGPAKVRPEG